jgi:hypothetical protein
MMVTLHRSVPLSVFMSHNKLCSCYIFCSRICNLRTIALCECSQESGRCRQWRLSQGSYISFLQECTANCTQSHSLLLRSECMAEQAFTAVFQKLRRTVPDILCFSVYILSTRNILRGLSQLANYTERPPLVGELSASYFRIEGATWSVSRIPSTAFSDF